MASKGQKFKKYDAEFRSYIIDEILQQQISIASVAKMYNINRNTIESWIRSYQKGCLNSKKGRPAVANLEEYWKQKALLAKKYLATVKIPFSKKSTSSVNWKQTTVLKIYAEHLKFYNNMKKIQKYWINWN